MTIDPRFRGSIASIGRDIGPAAIEAVVELYDEEQRALAARSKVAAKDQSYGPHERHKLDIYTPLSASASVPVVVWVHGGGFLRGDKGQADGDQWQNANAGRAFAQAGFIGVVINYRLAPADPWPAGAEDLSMVVAWLTDNIAQFGGDPSAIILAGSSAGGAHVAGYLKFDPDHARRIRGAVFFSGAFGVAPLVDHRDRSYYGEDERLHPERVPLEAVAASHLPLLVMCAEFDPPAFQCEFLGLLQKCFEERGSIPRSYIASGHNHYSLALHLGTGDSRVLDEVVSFVSDSTRR